MWEFYSKILQIMVEQNDFLFNILYENKRYFNVTLTVSRKFKNLVWKLENWKKQLHYQRVFNTAMLELGFFVRVIVLSTTSLFYFTCVPKMVHMKSYVFHEDSVSYIPEPCKIIFFFLEKIILLFMVQLYRNLKSFAMFSFRTLFLSLELNLFFTFWPSEKGIVKAGIERIWLILEDRCDTRVYDLKYSSHM